MQNLLYGCYKKQSTQKISNQKMKLKERDKSIQTWEREKDRSTDRSGDRGRYGGREKDRTTMSLSPLLSLRLSWDTQRVRIAYVLIFYALYRFLYTQLKVLVG